MRNRGFTSAILILLGLSLFPAQVLGKGGGGFSGGGGGNRSFSAPSRTYSPPSTPRVSTPSVSPSPRVSTSPPSPRPTGSSNLWGTPGTTESKPSAPSAPAATTVVPSRPSGGSPWGLPGTTSSQSSSSAPAVKAPPKTDYDANASRLREQAASQKAFEESKRRARENESQTTGRTGFVLRDSPSSVPSAVTTTSRSVLRENRDLRRQLTYERIQNRDLREQHYFRQYTPVYYNDRFSPFLTGYLIGSMNSHQRADFVYHHYYDMDPARRADLMSRDPDMEQRVRELERQNLARNVSYVPQEFAENRDLIYSKETAQAAYQEIEKDNNTSTFPWFWVFAMPMIALAVGGAVYVIFKVRMVRAA